MHKTLIKNMESIRKGWEWFFGRQLTPAQLIRKNQHVLNRAIRQMDRERGAMERQERKIIIDIKKLAKEKQLDAVKILAKDLVQTRRYIKKFMLMKANLQAVSMNIISLQSQQAISNAIKGVTIAMRQMNYQLKLPKIKEILREFEKQNGISEMKNEMTSETIDEVMGDDGDEEESAGIVGEIFDELGLELNDQLFKLPAQVQAKSKKTAEKIGPVTDEEEESDIDVILKARLERLKRNK